MDATKVDRNWFECALDESGFEPVPNRFGILLVWTGLKVGCDPPVTRLKGIFAGEIRQNEISIIKNKATTVNGIV